MSQDLHAPGAMSAPARHPLVTFTVLTLLISWLPIIPYALGLFPGTLLACGPFLAAIITVAMIGGRKGLGSYFRRIVRWRISVGWYVLAALVPMVGWLIVACVNVLLGATAPSSAQLAGWTVAITSTAIFLINPLGGSFEEPGWRGFALPLLLRRHSALAASAILGVIWMTWHVPLFVAGLVPWPDALLVLVLSFVFTAIFLRTSESVLIAFVFHASMNGGAEFFFGLFQGAERVQMYWIAIALCAVAVIIAILARRPHWLRTPAIHETAAADGVQAGLVRH